MTALKYLTLPVMVFFTLNANALCTKIDLPPLERLGCRSHENYALSIYQDKNPSGNVFERKIIYISKSNDIKTLLKNIGVKKNSYQTISLIVPEEEAIDKRVQLNSFSLKKLGFSSKSKGWKFYGELIEYKPGREATQGFAIQCVTSVNSIYKPYTAISQCFDFYEDSIAQFLSIMEKV